MCVDSVVAGEALAAFEGTFDGSRDDLALTMFRIIIPGRRRRMNLFVMPQKVALVVVRLGADLADKDGWGFGRVFTINMVPRNKRKSLIWKWA